ncbi:MAG TPA: 6-bladed beta-propeller [Edaphocola sp.]|nr:6-bladed beta-propeller [Edaphocola sp.]
MKYILVVFSLLVIIYACKREKGGFVNNIAERTLEIDDVLSSGAKLGEKITGVSAIRLETNQNCMIGNVEQIKMHNEKFFILDSHNHALLVFNKKGRFLFKISAIGRGPGEYLFLRDFIIDDIKDEIIILGAHNKIIRYDNQGGFIAEKTLGFTPLKFATVSDGTFYFWNGINSSGQAPLVRTDVEFNVIESYFNDVVEELTTSNMFTFYEGETYLRPFFDKHENIIYKLSSSGVEAKHQLDFGSKNWPKSIDIHRDSPLRDDDYIYGVRNFFEGNKYISFSFSLKKLLYQALYNKKTQQSYCCKSYFAGTLPEAIISSIQFFENEVYYSVVEPFYIKEYLDTYKMNDSNYDYSLISGKLKEIYSLLDEVNESDNPILFTFAIF